MATYITPESLHVGNGVETVFGFTWPYLSAADVYVEVGGVAVPTVFVSSSQVSVIPAPAPTTVVRIYRNTPAEYPRYQFALGVPMLPKYLDENSIQILFALAEGLLDVDEVIANAMEIAKRSLRVPSNEPVIDPLEPAASRANKVLGFDNLGMPLATLPASGSGTELAIDLASSDPWKGATMVKGAYRTIGGVADLRNIPAGSNQYLFLQYHTIPGDGGGGPYRYDGTDLASTDNNGSTIVSTDGARYKHTGNTDVHTWGARGVGASYNDAPAFLAMAAATNGAIRVRDKTYNTGYLQMTAYSAVSIRGVRRPEANATNTMLEAGSILIGGVYVESNFSDYADFGVDTGPGRGSVILDSLVSNAKPGQTGSFSSCVNVSAMGLNESNTTHGILIQGYDRHRMLHLDCTNHQFGVVDKNRNGLVSGITGRNIRTALMYAKGDVPAFAGGVADGTCASLTINGVRLTASSGNITAVALYIHASTAACSGISANGIHITGGYTPVRVQGSGSISDPAASGVTLSNITSDRAQIGFYADGFTYDLNVVNLMGTNPATGTLISLGTGTTGWTVDDFTLVLTDPAITGLNAAIFRGTGQWDGGRVRSAGSPSIIDVPIGSINDVVCGTLSGNCKIGIAGPLTGINGAVQASARLDIGPKRIDFSGQFNVTAASNKAICNTINTGKQVYTSVGAIVSGAYTTVAVRLNDFQITVEPSLPSGITSIDLTGLTVHL